MRLNKVVASRHSHSKPVSLAACGSAKAPAAAPAVTHTVTAPAATPKPSATKATPAPTTSAPTTPAPAPAKTVYAQPAAPAQPAHARAYRLRPWRGFGRSRCEQRGCVCGSNHELPFTLNVEAAWTVSGATNTVTANSPVTGQNYTMYCTGSDPTTCTGGNNVLVEFYF